VKNRMREICTSGSVSILRQMEQRVAADQRDIAPAGTMDVSRLAVRNQRLWRHLVRLAGAGQFGGGQFTQIVTRRLYRQFAADGPDIGTVMYPDGAPRCDWPLPAGAAGHELAETEMTEFVASVGGEYYIAERREAIRACNDSSQQTSPPPRSEVDCHHELRGVMQRGEIAVRPPSERPI
jgi:hypothetical protein